MNKTYEILDRLFKEVCEEESTLLGGTKLGIAGQAIKSLKETRITFGNSKDNFIKISERNFRNCGIELNVFHCEQMKKSFNFYYVTLSADLIPSP